MPLLDGFFRSPFLAGLAAFVAMAFGIFVAAGDTCIASAADAPGRYSRSTLAPITSARDGSCKRKPAHPKAPRPSGSATRAALR